jgi:restriction system protein
MESDVSQRKLIAQLSICLYCGWWTVFRVHQGYYPRTDGIVESYTGAIGNLKEFDLVDISVPISDLRKYLYIKRQKIFELHPRIFEEIVGSVFKDYGWEVKVTAFSGDNGVDVILTDSKERTIGIQVRRHKKSRKIEAEQIRALAGALILNGLTEGIFVTTSSYRKGAVETAKKFSRLGYPIKLIDCKKFFEALEIAQIKQFNITEEYVKNKVLCDGAYLGDGIEKPFEVKEDIYSRQIIGSIYTKNELIDLHAKQVSHSATEISDF